MSQSIDFSTVTDATFNGTSISEILLNGNNIWTAVTTYDPYGFVNVSALLIKAPDAADSDWAAQSSSIAKDVIVFGSNGHDDHNVSGGNDGAAYIFNRTGSFLAEVTSLVTNSLDSEGFGTNVSTNGNEVYVCENNVPAISVFSATGAPIGTIASPTGTSGFGTGVGSGIASTEDYILIGNFSADQVHLFDANTHSHIRTITCPLPSTTFGRSLDIKGETMVVGSYIDQFVHVFSTSGALISTIYRPSAPGGGGFGRGVSMSEDEDVIVITDPDGGDGGHAWLFNINGTLITELVGNPDLNGFYGRQSSINGDTIVIGASHVPGSTSAGSAGALGAIAIFDITGTHIRNIIPSVGGNDEFFGSSVDVDGDTIIVGASNNDNPYNSGGLWIYKGA